MSPLTLPHTRTPYMQHDVHVMCHVPPGPAGRLGVSHETNTPCPREAFPPSDLSLFLFPAQNFPFPSPRNLNRKAVFLAKIRGFLFNPQDLWHDVFSLFPSDDATPWRHLSLSVVRSDVPSLLFYHIPRRKLNIFLMYSKRSRNPSKERNATLEFLPSGCVDTKEVIFAAQRWTCTRRTVHSKHDIPAGEIASHEDFRYLMTNLPLHDERQRSQRSCHCGFIIRLPHH